MMPLQTSLSMIPLQTSDSMIPRQTSASMIPLSSVEVVIVFSPGSRTVYFGSRLDQAFLFQADCFQLSDSVFLLSSSVPMGARPLATTTSRFITAVYGDSLTRRRLHREKGDNCLPDIQ
jgi:hypothetical protein